MNIRDDIVLKNIHEGWLVGGCVRDFLMGKSSYDRDIAIFDAENFAKKIADKFNGTFVVLDSVNKIYRVVLPDKLNYLDISEIEGSSIEEDLKRRDFTINAIAYDLKTDEFIDITSGMEDLKTHSLRHIKDKNFEDDPLRILRAFRFVSTTGFEMMPELLNAIEKYKDKALFPAKERISYELMKLFGGKYTVKSLLLMDKFGILEEIFPCVKEMKSVPPNTHHHLDLFHHVIETVKHIEELYEKLPEKEKKHLDKIDFGGFPRINHLKLAGFLHDIGKYSTWTIEGGKFDGYKGTECDLSLLEKGIRQRFIKHDDVGAKMCVPLLKNLKFSKKQIDYISLMIKIHIYPSNVVASPDLNEKIMMRYIRKTGDNVIDNIILAKADRYSARGEAITEEMIKNNIEGLDKLLNFYMAKKDTLKPLPKLLDGFEVMKIKKISQGRELGEYMSALHEAQITGDILTKDDAIEFIKKL